MSTTIQVEEATILKLNQYKKEFNTTSYAKVFDKLILRYETRKMFGSLKGIGPWTKKDRMNFSKIT